MAGAAFTIKTSASADTWQQTQNFSVLHKFPTCRNHPIYSGGSTGLTDFFGAIVSPSISQRNCCGVRERTSSGLRSHSKRLSDNLLYNRSPSFPYQSFDTICAPPTEKVKGIRHIRSISRLRFHQCCQTVHSKAQICVAADNVDGPKASGVIQHSVSPQELRQGAP